MYDTIISQWPTWSLSSFGLLIGIFISLQFLHSQMNKSAANNKATKAIQFKDKLSNQKEFAEFQREYLVVYALVMLADWLQGTTMYTLYQNYGVNIRALFLTGFLSSAVFGTFIGPLVDEYGRKRACIIFLVLEIIINSFEHSSNFIILLIGRIMGGISTSLLFSAFESWMVSEHRKRGFADSLLSNTFGQASVINGIMAILAGFLSQISSDVSGDIGPFQLAIALTVIALVVTLRWPENYGNPNEHDGSKHISQAIQFIKKNQSVTLLGLAQAIFEGAMYTFVFMWVPTLQQILQHDTLPTGLVFACLMVCIAIGGRIYGLLAKFFSNEMIGIGICVLAILSLLVPVFTSQFVGVFSSFLIYEVCVGTFHPCCGTLRSKYFPEEYMGTITNIFRLPLNILVVVGTLFTGQYSAPTVYGVCCVWTICAAILHVTLYKRSVGSVKTLHQRSSTKVKLTKLK